VSFRLTPPRFAFATVLLALTLLLPACGRNPPPAASTAAPARHEHKPPHGGTPVALGDEAYHLELVRDATAGTLQAYVLDGEMENFIRTATSSFEVVASVHGAPQTLLFKPVANPVTGEIVGDTSLFEAQADWLKTMAAFDATLRSLTIRGTTFSDVKFNFPRGNDKD
jgi:hypothetical protein